MQELMSISDVQEELGCSRSTVYNLLNSGELDSVKIGAFRRITRESFNAYLERCFEQATRGK